MVYDNAQQVSDPPLQLIASQDEQINIKKKKLQILYEIKDIESQIEDFRAHGQEPPLLEQSSDQAVAENQSPRILVQRPANETNPAKPQFKDTLQFSYERLYNNLNQIQQ